MVKNLMGVGFFELLVILVLVLVLIKPENLPSALYRMGQVFAKIRRFYQMCYFQWTKALEHIETTTQLKKSRQQNVPSKLDNLSR